MTDELLDALHDEGLLTPEELDTTLDMQQTRGGSLLRCLELATPEVSTLWQRLAQLHGRETYTHLSRIETLEEAVRGEGGRVQPLLPRDLALWTLTLAQRREGEVLRLLTPDPTFDPVTTRQDHATLWARAAEVSPTGRGQLACALLTPPLYRTCVRLTYPVGIAGTLRLTDRLAVLGLVPGAALSAYHGREHAAVDAGLIMEEDYAACLAEHLTLPLYDHRPPTAEDRVLPEDTIRLHDLYPIEVQEGRELVVLTARTPDEALTRNLTRLSGRAVTFEITTPTVIRTLIQKRGMYAH